MTKTHVNIMQDRKLSLQEKARKYPQYLEVCVWCVLVGESCQEVTGEITIGKTFRGLNKECIFHLTQLSTLLTSFCFCLEKHN